MNASNIFKKVDYNLLKKIKSKVIIDPLNVINSKKLALDLTKISMGKN